MLIMQLLEWKILNENHLPALSGSIRTEKNECQILRSKAFQLQSYMKCWKTFSMFFCRWMLDDQDDQDTEWWTQTWRQTTTGSFPFFHKQLSKQLSQEFYQNNMDKHGWLVEMLCLEIITAPECRICPWCNISEHEFRRWNQFSL